MSEFVMITDPDGPVHDLQVTIDEQCTQSERVSGTRGELILRFPEACKSDMGPYVEVLRHATTKYSELIKPLHPTNKTTTQYVLEASELGGNLQFKTRGSGWIALANEGCRGDRWWSERGYWDMAIGTLFHELVHEDVAEAIPRKTSTWIEEGLATYISREIKRDLISSFDLDMQKASSAHSFVGASSEFISKVFDPQYTIKPTTESAVETWRAYELYLGVYEAAALLDKPLHTKVLEISSTGSRKERRRTLNAIDPVALHAEVQALRDSLISEANDRVTQAGSEQDRDRALAVLGRLGACASDATPVLPWNEVACTPRAGDLGQYYGACLELPELRGFIEAMVPCGNLGGSSGWIWAADGLARRFPEDARSTLKKALEIPFPALVSHVEGLIKQLPVSQQSR